MILTRKTIELTQHLIKRNYGISAVLLSKASDPIQQLFVDKVREYGLKSKGTVSLLAKFSFVLRIYLLLLIYPSRNFCCIVVKRA